MPASAPATRDRAAEQALSVTINGLGRAFAAGGGAVRPVLRDLDLEVGPREIVAFFPVYTIVGSALRHVDEHLLEAGRAFGLHGLRLFATVQLPAVVPSTVSALRLALAQSWLFLVAAELIASSMGLGFLLLDSGQNGRIDRIFLAIISLAVLGKLTDSILSLFEKWAIKKWA
jgi:sulfonate transport system permease protein